MLGSYLFALLQQGLPAADKAAVGSHLSSGTELRSRGISEHLPAMCWAGAGSPGVATAHSVSPTTPDKFMHVPFKESGGPAPHPRAPPITC